MNPIDALTSSRWDIAESRRAVSSLVNRAKSSGRALLELADAVDDARECFPLGSSSRRILDATTGSQMRAARLVLDAGGF